MPATLHAIEARLTDDELAPAAWANFRLGPGEPTIPGRAVEERGWSLYCLDLDRRRALFLDIGPDVDLARSAFMKATQFRLARRALEVPFEALDGLAAAVPAPEKLILFFNIGRCGSTLVNAMLNEVEGVWSLSEPDFTFDMLMQRASQDPAEARRLLATVDMEAEAVYPEELLAASWAFDLAEYRRLLAVGVPFLAIRYNELDADRERVAARLLQHCGLPAAALPAALRAFERDSQAGSRLARDHREAVFTDANLARFHATLARCPQADPTDILLPHVYAV